MAATKQARCIICNSVFEVNQRGNPKKCCSDICRRKRKQKYEREYYVKHITIRKTQKLQTRRNLKLKIIKLLGNKCCKCGESDIRCLQIDHINGGGGAERKGLSVWRYYKKILHSIESNENKYQCLCANCNFRKRNDKNQLI